MPIQVELYIHSSKKPTRTLKTDEQREPRDTAFLSKDTTSGSDVPPHQLEIQDYHSAEAVFRDRGACPINRHASIVSTSRGDGIPPGHASHWESRDPGANSDTARSSPAAAFRSTDHSRHPKAPETPGPNRQMPPEDTPSSKPRPQTDISPAKQLDTPNKAEKYNATPIAKDASQAKTPHIPHPKITNGTDPTPSRKA